MTSKAKKPRFKLAELLNQKDFLLERHGKMIIAAELQRRYGLRAAEVLNICESDVIGMEYIHIHGLKRSNDRYIHCPDLVHQLVKPGTSRKSIPVFPFNYRKYYAWFKKYLGGIPNPGKKNARVTHRFRQEVIRKLKQGPGTEDSGVSGFIGHKSKKTLKYYLPKKTK